MLLLLLLSPSLALLVVAMTAVMVVRAVMA